MSLPELPPLARRVAGLLGGTAGGAPARDIGGDLPGGEAALLDLLVRWRLAAEVAASLSEGHGLSRAAVRSLAVERERVAVAASLRAISSAAAGEALAARGLRAMLLKGGAVVPLTHGDPSRRPMADIDILVASEAVDDAVAALTARGLERSRHDTPLHVVLLHPRPGQARATALELHRDILDPPHPFELGLAPMLARATPDPASGLFLPTPADALTLACVHLLFHEHDARKTLLTLRDIAHLSRVVEPNAVGTGNADIEALVSRVAERAIAWAGADAALLAATPHAPSTWSRRLALSAALRELDAGVADPDGARWRVIGRRLGCALWWPSVPQRVGALTRLILRASPGAVGRGARGLRSPRAASKGASGHSGAAKRG